MNLGMSGGGREYLGDCKLATGGSPRPASLPYERTRSWALLAPPLGQHPSRTARSSRSAILHYGVYHAVKGGYDLRLDIQLFAPQSGGLNVAAQAENMILKLMLTRSRALLLGSTEWGSQAGNSKSVPSRTRTTT